jgi:hypothetical protein
MEIKNKGRGFDLREEKFWHEVGDFLRYGIPAHDNRGHSSEIRFRVRPVQLDIIGSIREKMPENLFKTHAALYRGLLAVGCKTSLEYLKKYDPVSSIETVDRLIEGLNKISKKERLKELEKDIEGAQHNILRSSMEDKSKIIDLLDRMKENVKNIQAEM